MESVLAVRDVHHRFGATTALAGVDLDVAAGECVALLGPNGAGKTTLIGLATGLLNPQRGHVEVGGGDPRIASTRRRLGVVQQSVGFPRTLTVRELVRGAAIRAGLSPAAVVPILTEVGIADLATRRAGKLSGGQQQRVQLAMGLVSDPALLLLDEPTVGLDVNARRGFWRTLAARRDRGTGVLLTTHLVEEAAAFADRVVVIDHGRIIASDTPTGLTNRLPDRTIIARTRLDDLVVRSLDGVASFHRDGELVRIGSPHPERVLRDLLGADPDLTDLRVEGATLEEALHTLTTDTAEVAA